MLFLKKYCRPQSGKTTLVNSFLRLTDAVDGSIIIDDINIANIGSKGLRTQLTIISKGTCLLTISLIV